MATAKAVLRYVSRPEYVALVISNRPLLRTILETEQELLDRETQERFRIRNEDLEGPGTDWPPHEVWVDTPVVRKEE